MPLGVNTAGSVEDGDRFAVRGSADGEAVVHGRVHDRLIEGNILPKDGDAGNAGARSVNQRRAIGGNLIDGKLAIDGAGEIGVAS